MSLSQYMSVKVICRTGGYEPTYWANVHELDTGLIGQFTADNDAIATAFASFHRALLRPAFTVDRVVLSTWNADGVPYNPDTLYVHQAQMTGGLSSDAPAPLTSTLLVKRVGAVGRQGNLLLRGALAHQHILGGTLDSSAQAEYQQKVDAAQAALIASIGNVLSMVRRNSINFIESRAYTGFYVKGASVKQLRNGRKTKNVNNAFERVVQGLVEDLPQAASAVNAIITAFNALPLPDVPLLP